MDFKFIIGFDMSKAFFNSSVFGRLFDHQFDNDVKGMRLMLKKLKRLLGSDLSDCLFCLEHTGLYSQEIVRFLVKRELHVSLIAPLEIKKSLGIRRGKNDPIDARRIAEYGARFKDKIILYELPEQDIIDLKDLLSLRAKHVRTRAGYKARLNEQRRVIKKSKSNLLFKSQLRLIKQLDKEIDLVEAQIIQIISNNAKLKEYYDLMISIKGIGMITAISIIVKTQCFTLFTSWRKFACYCGTAPFRHQSGNYKGKTRISKIGNQSVRSLLTLAARSASLHDPELKAYKERRILEGVDKKKITNMIRNKLLARIFSVIKRKSPYVVLHRYAI